MLLTRYALFSSLLISGSQAWLPGDHRQIVSREGVDLFNRSSLHEAGLLRKRYLPHDSGNDKTAIRGVNLGSLFVVEDWLSDDVFKGFGCSSKSEFDCVSSINDQDKANSDFQGHWGSWITKYDLTQMVSYGLNTVRIPVGYWFLESIVDKSEHFPQGGEHYLDQVIGWAKDAGLYVIIVLHGAPGAQATDAFTGQLNPNPGFYSTYNYDRAYQWLEWITNKVHTNPAYSTVGTLELVNEPERNSDTAKYPNAKANTDSLRQMFYPTAWSKIRATESSLHVPSDSQLSIMMMDQKWGSGDPKEYLPDLNLAAYDDHQYVKYAGVAEDKDAYIRFSCSDDRSGNWPVFVGEWSLSVATDVEWTDDWNPNRDENKDFYRNWWAAQVMSYERTAQGWIFWTWKTSGTLNDPRWDYKMEVAAGIIPTDIDSAYSMGACS
ncbi:Glucan endo-1,6-beta-glucosidase B [Cladophialophora carrionii]|uniref:glucan endo-1,6-beta-glucosidase n=1 Tax=Cladophialophora carrionii TaxID=86049 RepID=A0A1C1CCY8_9EURO|nr:Glucan endo-1,6-beta-glucosidase B [Cladophialophora carrionii]